MTLDRIMKRFLKKKDDESLISVLEQIRVKTINVPGEELYFYISPTSIVMEKGRPYQKNDTRILRNIFIMYLLSIKERANRQEAKEYLLECLETSGLWYDKKKTTNWVKNLFNSNRSYYEKDSRHSYIWINRPIKYEIT